MKTSLEILLFGILFILVVDGLLYLAVKSRVRRAAWRWIYGAHTLVFVAGMVAYHFVVPRMEGPVMYRWVSVGVSTLLAFYAPKSVYLLFTGVSLLFKAFRLAGVARVMRKTGVVVAMLLFVFSLYGITVGRSAYKVERVTVEIPGLSPAFDGFRVVQLSDLHLGSCGPRFRGIPKLVERVNGLYPDLVVFTGDMVNNFASELDPWIEVLRGLKAPMGKYAVTGNHDYGQYVRWDSPDEKEANFSAFLENMAKAGFTMLNNEHVSLTRGTDTVFLAGVENWGLPPFPQYGNLSRALAGTSGHPVILLSHDPTHWRAEVLHHPVALTLAGHTHAMQVGIRVGAFRWSPSRYIYPEYNGLYREGEQYLYVSRGAGYIGLAGRLGQRPEITLIELKCGR